MRHSSPTDLALEEEMNAGLFEGDYLEKLKEIQRKKMKITCISDTHGLHYLLKPIKSDILIHAGDFLNKGTYDELYDFTSWLMLQECDYKIVIAGNHDKYCYEQPVETEQMFNDCGIIYLRNSSVDIDDMVFWGSPFSKYFKNWYFNIPPGEEAEYWKKIPEKVNVLITHGAPHGYGDYVKSVMHSVGDIDLGVKVIEIQPKLHIFGHLHDGYGIYKCGNIQYINASVLDENYTLQNEPISIIL